ncbi:MAG: hypothetical protein CM1200mP41_11570 [Gammaproteobacteria bacterium]|nr:MAG: hypothetical protein CM1200mP41_11570 [Gammaproteobacteria bacterium]
MTDKVVKKQTADESVDVSRRRVNQGAAAGPLQALASSPVFLTFMRRSQSPFVIWRPGCLSIARSRPRQRKTWHHN